MALNAQENNYFIVGSQEIDSVAAKNINNAIDLGIGHPNEEESNIVLLYILKNQNNDQYLIFERENFCLYFVNKKNDLITSVITEDENCADNITRFVILEHKILSSKKESRSLNTTTKNIQQKDKKTKPKNTDNLDLDNASIYPNCTGFNEKCFVPVYNGKIQITPNDIDVNTQQMLNFSSCLIDLRYAIENQLNSQLISTNSFILVNSNQNNDKGQTFEFIQRKNSAYWRVKYLGPNKIILPLIIPEDKNSLCAN